MFLSTKAEMYVQNVVYVSYFQIFLEASNSNRHNFNADLSITVLSFCCVSNELNSVFLVFSQNV